MLCWRSTGQMLKLFALAEHIVAASDRDEVLTAAGAAAVEGVGVAGLGVYERRAMTSQFVLPGVEEG